MDFGNKIIYKCPSCKKLTGSYSVTSTNDFGATIYSDGYTRGMMYADNPEIAKCVKCKTIYWLKEENITGEYTPLTINSKWQKAPEPVLLNRDEFIEALKQKLYRTKVEERYLRYNIWLAFNDEMRRQRIVEFTKEEKKIYESNCKKLFKLYDIEDTEEKILIAELHRNLGNFDGSAEILKTIKQKQYLWIVKLLLKECEHRNKKVIKLIEGGVKQNKANKIKFEVPKVELFCNNCGTSNFFYEDDQPPYHCDYCKEELGKEKKEPKRKTYPKVKDI